MQEQNLVNEDLELLELKEQILDLQRKNKEQEIVIEGLKQRSHFLEDYITKQKSFIDNAMHKINGIINSSSNIIKYSEPKKLKDKILSKFTKKKDSKISDLTHGIMDNSAVIEQKYLSTFLTSDETIGTTEEFLEGYIKQNGEKGQNKDLDKEI